MKAILVNTHEQLQQCLAIRRAVFIEEQHVPESLEIDEYDALGACVHILLLNSEDQPIATARFKPYDAQTAKVQRVAVLPSYRGNGCGSQVMAFIEQTARNLGFQRTVLDAQVTAEGFYRTLDYRLVSPERFLDAGIEHVRMYKQL